MTNTMMNPARQLQGEDDTLSALFDGELADEQARPLIRRLAAGGPERERFREYCLIGDALRGLDHDMPGLTNRVMAALEDEPTVLAPVRKPVSRRPALWLAAATVASITWGLWNTHPRQEVVAPLAGNPPASQQGNVLPYLAAHQDFAQAVVSPSEMRMTRVTLVGAGQ